jgi:hypothetical protein
MQQACTNFYKSIKINKIKKMTVCQGEVEKILDGCSLINRKKNSHKNISKFKSALTSLSVFRFPSVAVALPSILFYWDTSCEEKEALP